MTIRETAIAAAQAAGAIQKAHFGTRLNVDVDTQHDVKLEADRLCEEAIVGTIRERWPEHAILTEETGAIGGTGECVWYTDPLDGTVNFFHNIPYFCTSVACYRRPSAEVAATPRPRGLEALGEPIVGVVYAPPTDELFVAEAGKGATLNGQPIAASRATRVAEAMVGIGFGARPGCVDHFVEQVTRLAGRVRKLRSLGAAAYDLCNLAAGRLTAFYEMRLRSWDIAAAHIVMREAGAVLDAIEIEPHSWNVVAAAPGVYHDFLRLARGPQEPRP